MDFISQLNGTYFSIPPAGGISRRKCEKGKDSQVPQGLLEFIQIKQDKSALNSLLFFLHPSV